MGNIVTGNIFFFICIFLFTASFKEIEVLQHEFEERVIVLSYPRSGRHWMAYSLYHIAPSYNVYASFLRTRFQYRLEKDSNKAIFPRHRLKNCQSLVNFPNENDKVVLLMRNYRESYLRHSCDDIASALELLKNDHDDLYQNLYFFDLFPEDRKLLIYYEDLILEPEVTFRKLLNFLGEDLASIDSYMASFEEHQRRMITLYDKVQNGARSKGKDLLYHTKLIPQKVIKEMDQHVKTHHPLLWKKYLSRYEYRPEQLENVH